MILQRLLKDVDPKSPPKPCDFFDMIGGTSTGGSVGTGRGPERIETKVSTVLLLSCWDV